MNKIKVFFLFVVGAIIGFVSMIYIEESYNMRGGVITSIKPSVKNKIDMIYNSYTNVVILVVVAIIIVLVVFFLVRLFSSSANVNDRIFIGQLVADIVLGIVLTETIFVYLDRLFRDNFKSFLDTVNYRRAYIVAFMVVYVLIGLLLNFAAQAVIKDPKRNCRLDIWQVKNEKEFAYFSEVIKKQTFEDCYGLMRHRGIPLGQMQFYVISELDWRGKKVVGQWKYYANGDNINMDDDALRTKLMVAKNAENVKWQL